MSDLYIANATHHNQEIMFRLPEVTQTRNRRIEPGGQLRLPDLSVADVDYILKQNVPYGWTEVSRVDRERSYTGVIYSVDKPVPAARIRYAIGHNVDVLELRGQENRKLAAVATTVAVEKQITEAGAGSLANMSVSFEEQENRNKPTELSSVVEEYEVNRGVQEETRSSNKPQRPRR